MGRSKLDKFRDNDFRDNVIQAGKPLFESIKGKWRSLYFNNDNPLVVELACGKGDYTVGLARLFPGMNFIGVDIKGSRIWTGSASADREGLKNAAFLRTHILELEKYFEENEVDSIWITFPDPRPKERDVRKRLTSPRFLEIYRKVVKPDGQVFLKTDNMKLFQYSLDVIRNTDWADSPEYTDDLYSSDLAGDHFGLMTNYEKRFLEEGIKIKYLKFRVRK